MKKGWELKKIGDVCEIGDGNHGGNYPKKSDMRDFGVPFIRSVNLVNGEVSSEDIKYISEEKHKSLNKGHLKTGDVLFTNRGDIGKSAIVGSAFDDANLNSQIAFFRCSSSLYNKYLYYFLQSPSLQNHLFTTKTGAALQQFPIGLIVKIEIPIPPLPEQQRIVSVLDEAFAAIAQAKSSAERNLVNARELFETISHDIFSSPHKDWQEKKLGDLCEKITKGSSPKWQGIKYVNEPGILFITSENVGVNEIILDKRKYVEEKFNISDKKSILQKGDVLTNIVGASIGRTAIFNLDDLANINQAVCILRCKEEILHNLYLSHLLNSPFFREILHDNEVDNARANLSLGFFSNLAIPVPPLAEQRAIVGRLEALSAETGRLEEIYWQKVESLEELKKSVLGKAFEGEI